MVTETVFNLPGRRALPGPGDPVARLPDRAEPRHVHRDRRDPRRTWPWTCCTASSTRASRYGELGPLGGRPRPASRWRPRAPGGADGRSGASCRKKPLGAAGGVLMVVMRRDRGLRRPAGDARSRSPPTRRRCSARPERRALAGHRQPGPRHLLAHRARRARLAGRGPGVDAARLGAGRRSIGLLSGYVGGRTDLVDPAGAGHPAGAAAARARARDVGRARARRSPTW